ncbi:S8 family peptidase [Paenibacillus sp. sptzw28]|uniref:S8 family peptidase n=1 Tax=Paenibacillus sp. sptzw28 TaxID=715179 RepID=UPI001C6EA0FE|nr:S8 family peptidase [Paenibacillus sp. sptzw28]QYR20792.1 S8 family peptidase [Paenibacillus sp. sptzw28]
MDKIRLIQPQRIALAASSVSAEIPEGIDFIQAPQLWAQGHTGKGVVIAVIDTGADATHPDLTNVVIGGRNFTTESTPEDISDKHGHGTHVTGTIAAQQNGVGVVGAAPSARVLALKVLDRNGQGSVMSLIDALDYARNWTGPAGEKVRIINMSLGGPTDYPGLHKAIIDCDNAGIIINCAAGNDGDGSASTDELSYPGAYNEVVSVGAADTWGHVAPFSSSNDQVDLVAPGVAVKSTIPGGGYALYSGTSMATPHVSAAAALIINQWEHDYGRKITEPELYAQLIKRTITYDYDRRLQGAGVLRLTVGYSPPPEWEAITIAQAVDILTAAGVIETPSFWLNLLAKFKANPEQYKDFRYVELLIRKAAAKIN